MVYLICFLASAIGGLLVGSIGTGSSLIVLPTLVIVFDQLLPNIDSVRIAAGTTMATIAVGAIAGGVSRYRAGQVDPELIRLLALPYVFGAFVGPWLATYISTPVLKTYIACLIIFIAVQMLLGVRPTEATQSIAAANKLAIMSVLTLIALLSSMGGIASGVFAIPFLMRFSLPLQTILGTSTMGAGIFASTATLSYISAGIGDRSTNYEVIGYVHLPIFFCMATTAAVFTPIGVRLSKQLEESVIKNILAVFLFASAIVILLNGPLASS